MSNLVIVLIVFSFSAISVARKDYYWRDYDGIIPEDALSGGRDNEGRKVYIGQTYISQEGLIPVQINSGIKSVYAEIKGVKFSNQNIKILCGPSKYFDWVPTNSSSLHVDLINKQPVIGGYEDNWGTYFIGRISSNQNACVGKVLENGVDGRCLFYCVNKYGRYQQEDLYEVLVNVDGKEKVNL